LKIKNSILSQFSLPVLLYAVEARQKLDKDKRSLKFAVTRALMCFSYLFSCL